MPLSSIDTRDVVGRLRFLESLAVIPRVASTNLVARRIVNECIENELSLPQAVIVAGEQFAGHGRNQRKWSSPAGKGIYATILLTRPTSELTTFPLRIANVVASYLQETYGIDARVKWPNDILVNGRKIAGILIEARIQEERAFLLIGIGINIEPVSDDARPNAIAITEANPRNYTGLVDATVAFVEHLDEKLAIPGDSASVLDEWRALTVHRPGDAITCILGDRTVTGAWDGVDDYGRALLRNGSEVTAIAAGELIL
jgi:BirA family transcriptional regulator, biotin operon repressor / biotin---[acetyl-CoA-carboxylase] ligase